MIRFLLGCLSLILYVVTMVVIASLVIVSALILFLIPVKSWRHGYQKNYLQHLPAIYALLNSWIMAIATHGKWDISGTGTLHKNKWYVMISNHQSWMDILVLYHVFKCKIPPL